MISVIDYEIEIVLKSTICMKVLKLYIMYIDESGVEEIKDQTKYFVTSGVIFHESGLAEMKKKITDFKESVFVDDLKDLEIHVHDIYKGKNDFYGLKLERRMKILDELYASISNIRFSITSVAIDKPNLLNSKWSDYDVLEKGYTFLIERFDNFLRRTNNKGIVRIDKTSNKSIALNKKDCKILDIVNHIRKHGTNLQSIKNIAEEPFFIESHLRKGLQIADAIVYCTNSYLNTNEDFKKYWDMLEHKIHTSNSGSIWGYGLYVFPK